MLPLRSAARVESACAAPVTRGSMSLTCKVRKGSVGSAGWDAGEEAGGDTQASRMRMNSSWDGGRGVVLVLMFDCKEESGVDFGLLGDNVV